VKFIAAHNRNPFGMSPPCAHVPGYGDTNANFHVVGDHPGVHGGAEAEIPFTGMEWSEAFFGALREAGLVERAPEDGYLDVSGTFFSYLHMCLPENGTPGAASYASMEPYFDSEVRAITAHVLVPVGARATEYVLDNYTPAGGGRTTIDTDTLHATEIQGSGWLVVPIKEPAEWDEGDSEALVDALVAIQETDFRQVSDLGRFMPGGDPYMVR